MHHQQGHPHGFTHQQACTPEANLRTKRSLLWENPLAHQDARHPARRWRHGNLGWLPESLGRQRIGYRATEILDGHGPQACQHTEIPGIQQCPAERANGLVIPRGLGRQQAMGADIRVGYRSTYREPSFQTSLRSILLARRQRRGGLHPQEESEDHSRGGEEQCGEPHHWLGAFPPPLQSPSHHHRGREGHQARGIPQHGLTETV